MADNEAPGSSSPVSDDTKPQPVMEFRRASINSNAEPQNKLHRDISLRQLCCMAMGSSIGAGILVASGIALGQAGPGSTVLGYGICGLMVVLVMGAVGETSTSYPVNGAFYDYSVRFISPAWGFAMGWNFVINWLIILPFELTILAIKLQSFAPDINVAVFVAIFLVALSVVGLLGAKMFAEVEHWAGLVKAVALTMFIFIAIVIITRGTPGDNRGAVGAQYWHDPGAFLNGFQGFMIVFSIAGISYGGSEVLGLTVAECRNPRRMMPIAVKLSFVRILVLCVLTLLMAGFVVPADDPTLNNYHKHGANISPFVQAMELAKLLKLATFYKVVIIIAVMSMANTSIYASSRALQALCAKGMGPRVFAKVIKFKGLPVYAVVVAIVFGCLAFVSSAPEGNKMFLWLLSIAGLSNYFTWGSILVSQIRMRQAMREQRREPRDLLWRNPFGIWGSWLGLFICVLGVLAPVITAFWPLSKIYDGEAIARNIFGFFGIVALWLGYHFYQRRWGTPHGWLVPLSDIDLDTGLRGKNDIVEVSSA